MSQNPAAIAPTIAPSVFHAYARPTAAASPVLRGSARTSDQHHHRRKIKSKDQRRGKHGQRAGDKLREHESAKRFVRRAQDGRQHFDQAREKYQEDDGCDSAVSVCVIAKVMALAACRRLHRSKSALPSTIPVRNVPSISVNA